MTETAMNLSYTRSNVSEDDNGEYYCKASNAAGTTTSDTITLHYSKPEVTLDDQDVHIGQNTIEPIVSGNPINCTFQWSTDLPGNDEAAIDQPTFIVNVPESVDDKAVFTVNLTVTNSIGSTFKSIQITVKNKHEAKLDDPFINLGEEKIISADVSCNPKCTSYQWDTDLPGNEDTVKDKATFTLTAPEDLEEDGAGYVNVTVNNMTGSTNASAKIIIPKKLRYPRHIGLNGEIPDVTVKNVTGLLNQDFTINCTYTINNGMFLAAIWYNSTSTGDQLNELVHSNLNPTNGRFSIDVTQPGIATCTLTIANTMLSDDGYYMCVVVDSLPRSNSDYARLTIQYIIDQTPDVLVQNSVGLLNQESTINCTYTINSGTFVSAVWYNSTSTGEELNELVHSISNPTNGRYSINVAQPGIASLTITNTTISDDGYYMCVITDSGPRTKNDYARLTLQYIDEVIIAIDSYSNSSLTMVCSGNGNPVPQLMIYHNSRIIMTGTTTLTLTRRRVSDDDNGQYYCEAYNTAGTVTSGTIILDYYKPEFELPEYMIVDYGDNVVIAINNISANPNDVTYQWTINDPDINDTDTNPATFSFTVSDEDKSAYVISVNVTNVIGSNTNSIKIIVSSCNCSPVSETCDKLSKGLTVGMTFVGILIGAFGIIFGQIGYTKIRQKKLIENRRVRKTDKKKQEMYMEYMSEPSSQIYQDLQHRVQEESAYVNVKIPKNNKI